MADNVVANAGSGGATFATDDDGTAHHPYVKVEFGADNTQTKVSSANPLPVVQTGTHTVTGAGGTFPVTDSAGSLTVDAPVGTPAFVRISDGVAAVDTLPVSLASVPSHAVTNAGIFAVQATIAAAATNVAKAEDAASADADVGVPAMAVRKATPANTSGLDGDYEMLQMSAGRLWASATIDAALPAGTNAIGKLAANSGVDIGDVDILSIAAGDNNIGNVDIVTMPNVTLAAGTNTNEVVGDVAHDAVAAGNPLRVGAKAETALSGITLVADGDATDLYAGVDGVLIVRNHSNLEDVVQERTTNIDGASTAFASGLAAPGVGIRLWITNVDLCNSSASFITVDLRDGAAGAVLWTLPVPATGGVVKAFDPPLKLTANTALAFDASAATTTLTISANGFKSKV